MEQSDMTRAVYEAIMNIPDNELEDGEIEDPIPISTKFPSTTSAVLSQGLRPRPHDATSSSGPFASYGQSSSNLAPSSPPIPVQAPMEPAWYLNVNTKTVPRRVAVQSRGKYISLNYVRDCYQLAVKETVPNLLEYRLDRLRNAIHEAAFLEVTPYILRMGRTMDSRIGLPAIFHHPAIPIPFDIKSDAKELYERWHSQRFTIDLLYGIKSGKASTSAGGNGLQVSDKIKKCWKQFGHNHLHNGQWWPLQICLVRDGAHGAMQAGISGIVGEGAVSIVVAGRYDDDFDGGEFLWYTGTRSKDASMTTNTRLMEDARVQDRAIRVFRSSNLNSIFKPRRGYRYDGLYKIVEAQLVDRATAHWKFRLRRESGQDPIRHNGREVRPTQPELRAFEANKRLVGLG